MSTFVTYNQADTHPAPPKVESKTLFLALVIYGGWMAATFFHRLVPIAATPVLGGWILAWHGSLQHETIHGHPTRSRRLNTLIGFAPLSLWLPYELYRKSHLAHHVSPDMTHPESDPESRYLLRRSGLTAAIEHGLARGASTLLGRLILGPFIEVMRFFRAEFRSVSHGDLGRLRIWSTHVLHVAMVVIWLKIVCQMSLLAYAALFIYPGAALSLLRSFAEHRAAPLETHRVAIVEDAPVFGLLFLNNNLHAAHHLHPAAPWTELPRLYQARRAEILLGNGGLVYKGYREIFKRFLLAPHDTIFHPSPRGVRGDAS